MRDEKMAGLPFSSTRWLADDSALSIVQRQVGPSLARSVVGTPVPLWPRRPLCP